MKFEFNFVNGKSYVNSKQLQKKAGNLETQTGKSLNEIGQQIKQLLIV